jgi:hypothetical protein
MLNVQRLASDAAVRREAADLRGYVGSAADAGAHRHEIMQFHAHSAPDRICCRVANFGTTSAACSIVVVRRSAAIARNGSEVEMRGRLLARVTRMTRVAGVDALPS